MIKNYLYTIGKYLSHTQREDVLKEVESNLYDYLEENFGEKEYTHNEIEEAIRSMGHPKKVAEAYMNSPRCLIGPAYIDTYWLILKIATISVAFGIIVSNLIGLPDGKASFLFFLDICAQIINSLFATVGVVTFIFATIQYFSPQTALTDEEPWSLDILEDAPEPSQSIKVFDLILETFFICITFVILNHVTFHVGLSFSKTLVIPVINMTYFAPFIPWINLMLAITLLLNMYLLIKRRWQTVTRIISIVESILSIVLFAFIVNSPEIFDLSVISDTITVDKDGLINAIQIGLNIGLAAIIIGNGVEIYKHVKAIYLSKNTNK